MSNENTGAVIEPTITINSSMSVTELADVRDTIVPYGFLRWDAYGKSVIFEKNIPVSSVTGLSSVARSGSFNDLTDLPNLSKVAYSGKYEELINRPAIPKNYDFSFVGLIDTYDTAINNGFVRWNDNGTQLVYQPKIKISDIESYDEVFSTIAFSGEYNDLKNKPDLSSLFDNLGSVISDLKDLNGINYDPQLLTDGMILSWDGSSEEWVPGQADPSSFIALTDTLDEVYGPETLGNKYLRWNTAGTEIIYETNISAINVTGLADVATTGDLNDLINVEYSESRIKSRSSLSVLVYDKNTDTWVDESSQALGIGDGKIFVEELNDLADVEITIPRTGETLIYDEIAQKWKDGRLSFTDLANAPTNGTYRLTGLADTSANPVRNGYLRWNSAGTSVTYETFIPSTTITGLAPVATSGSFNDLTNVPVIPTVLNQLTDVDTTGQQTGNALVFNGTRWVAGSASSALNFNDINDVNVLNAAPGDIVKYNGVQWVSAKLSAGSLLSLTDTAGASVPNGFLKWNSNGTSVEYTATISSSAISGLATVATSGSLYDLVDSPFSNPPVIGDMADVDTATVEDGDLLAFDLTTGTWLPRSGGSVISWNLINVSSVAEQYKGYLVDTTNSAVTVDLPASPSPNDWVVIGDYLGTFDKNPVFVNSIDQPIMGRLEALEADNRNAVIVFTFIDNTIGWKITDGIGEGITRDVVNWITVNSDAEMRVFDSWLVDTTNSIIEVTLPSNPQANDYVEFGDAKGTFDKNECRIVSNSHNIMNLPEDMIVNNRNAVIRLTFIDEFFGWKITHGIGETAFGGRAVINGKTIYVSVTGDDTTGNGTELSPYATVPKALEEINKAVIRTGEIVTISVGAGEHTYLQPIKVDLDQGGQVKIVGADPDPAIDVTGIQGITGAPGAYLINLQLTGTTGLAVGDYVVLTDTAADQSIHVVLRGVWKITSIGANSITVENSFGGSLPSFTNFTATVTKQNTVIKFTGSTGIWVPNKILKGLRNITIVGDKTLGTTGLLAGWNITESFELGAGQIFAEGNVNITGFGTGILSNISSLITISSSYVSGNTTGIAASDNASVETVNTTVASNSGSGIVAKRNSSSVCSASEIYGNGKSAVETSSGATVTTLQSTIQHNVLHAALVENGGNIEFTTTTINNNNGTPTFKATGSGQISIDNTDPDIEAGVTYEPPYKTLDIANNGVAIIGKY